MPRFRSLHFYTEIAERVEIEKSLIQTYLSNDVYDDADNDDEGSYKVENDRDEERLGRTYQVYKMNGCGRGSSRIRIRNDKICSCPRIWGAAVAARTPAHPGINVFLVISQLLGSGRVPVSSISPITRIYHTLLLYTIIPITIFYY